ncbi:unnamed protein product [Leptosia nina]|uniref:Ashwin n=1 Tax=Leptosia nina TaxID=320188 RepID=A0AAV1K110_9NEOP
MATISNMLLHPELMNNEQLICIIKERRLKIQNLHLLQRDELLSIFHQFCVPYGQRTYKDKEHERLKPPPDLLCGHIKRIKLDTDAQVVKGSDKLKRKPTLDSILQVADSTPPKKNRKLITWP